jgi:hypothetical protein
MIGEGEEEVFVEGISGGKWLREMGEATSGDWWVWG